jgi:hypothetical protein
MIHFNFDFDEFMNRVIKYVIEGFVVGVSLWLISGTKRDINDIFIVGLIAAATFSLLDYASPSIGASVRSGAGYGMGFNLVGFPMK